jgi:hypothetical protein
MEDLEKRAIEDLPVVSSVRLHAGDKTHKGGVYANLRCCATSPFGGCDAKLVGPIRKSIERPTNVDCFRELGRVIQRDHGPTCITAAQKNCKLLKKLLKIRPQNVLLMRQLSRSMQMTC